MSRALCRLILLTLSPALGLIADVDVAHAGGRPMGMRGPGMGINMPRVMSPRGMPTRTPGRPQVITFPPMTTPTTPAMTGMGTPLINSMNLAQTSAFLNRLRLANRLGYGFGMNPYSNAAMMSGLSGYGASGGGYGGSGGGYGGSGGGYGGGGGYSSQPSSSNTADPYQTYLSKYGSDDDTYSASTAIYGANADQSRKTSEM